VLTEYDTDVLARLKALRAWTVVLAITCLAAAVGVLFGDERTGIRPRARRREPVHAPEQPG